MIKTNCMNKYVIQHNMTIKFLIMESERFIQFKWLIICSFLLRNLLKMLSIYVIINYK